MRTEYKEKIRQYLWKQKRWEGKTSPRCCVTSLTPVVSIGAMGILIGSLVNADFDSGNLGRGLKFCISNRLPCMLVLLVHESFTQQGIRRN